MSEPEPTTEELAVHQDYEAMMAHRRAETEKKPDYTRVGRRHEATAQRLRDLQQTVDQLTAECQECDGAGTVVEGEDSGRLAHQEGCGKCGGMGRLSLYEEAIDKLPHCWDYRDGQWVKVPVVPGTQTCWCFYWDDDEGWKLSECRYVGHAYPWVEFDWELKNLPPELTKGVPVNCIYANREAAEQARKEQAE